MVPIEVVQYIIEYSTDIDVRRAFNVYGKLKNLKEKEEVLKSAFSTMVEVLTDSPFTDGFLCRHTLNNKLVRPTNSIDGIIPDDSINVFFIEFPNYIRYEIDIYKFKRKTLRAEDRFKESEFFFAVGGYGATHYWNAQMYNYIRY
uniref:Uncharacterized protein n=1 Tax=viral metagenome TaxID=1070528 RepID=A0A6C0I2Y7_9ZZZZ